MNGINGNDRRRYENTDRRDARPYPSERPPETIHKTVALEVERKTFQITRRENPRGDFLRITEDACGRFNCIIIPGPGVEAFKAALEQAWPSPKTTEA